MKTLESLRQSQSARVWQMKLEVDDLKKLVDLTNDSGPSVGSIVLMRMAANRITQCVHEISAYHNAMHTE